MEDEIIDAEIIDVPEIIGADVEPTDAAEQEFANDANMAANEFSKEIYAMVQKYQTQIPLNYMMKILTAVNVDLQAALIGTNVEYVIKQLQAQFTEQLNGTKSEIIVA